MKLSTNWIKELVPELTLSGKEIAELLTNHSFETVIDREYTIDPNITIVKILKLEQHPNADRLRLATITDGQSEIRVVCGAPNISEGDVVPYAPPGAKVYDEHGKLFELSVAKIRGVESPGMLNSPRELGLSSNHGGILLLPKNTPLGTKLIRYIPSDVILDADVLPDRARDITAHNCVAQEVAAITRLAYTEQSEQSEWKKLLESIAELTPFVHEKTIQESQPVRPIAFHPDRPSRVAGIEISHDDVRDILERLRFSVEEDGNTWAVIPPAERVDILGEHDIVDEVTRMIGYDRIPASQWSQHAAPIVVSDDIYWQQKIRETLVELGLTETYGYSFEDERIGSFVDVQRHPHVELTNPMAPELKNLRYSMLPGLIGAMIASRDEIHRNKKGNERALFEIGRVYHLGDGGEVPGIIERRVISGIAVGQEDVLQQVIDAICNLFSLVTPDTKHVEKPFAKCVQYSYGGEFFATGYIFNQELLKKMKYRLPVIAFEISVAALLKHAPDIEIAVKSLEDIRKLFTTP
ncbi:MAG TPA: hypothetical protein VLG69_01165, partial [Candidatus Andersenbacteria bacterium]|nr:hypothetical protein [Candidatus Andersenbacteria bacterium]